MKKLLLIPFLLLSIAGYSQMNTFGGIGLRVNDTTTYQTNAAAFHTAGYYDIYFNNQATNDHWDIWNGSSYDHIFAFGQGSGGAWGSITGTLSAQTDLQTALNGKLTGTPIVTTFTVDHVLASTDIEGGLTGKYGFVQMNSASPLNFTLPSDATLAAQIGTEIGIVQLGDGLLTVVQGSGATVTPPDGGNLLSPGKGQAFVAKKTAANTWRLFNGNAASALTKTDDTNVTLTLGGAPSASLLSAVSLTLGWTGTLSGARGGTGADNTTQTYTPTLTNSANITASTPRLCTYYRVGNAVTVSGQFDLDPTTTLTLTTLGMSLPIASALTTAFQAGGSASAIAVTDGSMGIFSDATNDRVTIQYVATDVTNHTFTFTFTYQVL